MGATSGSCLPPETISKECADPWEQDSAVSVRYLCALGCNADLLPPSVKLRLPHDWLPCCWASGHANDCTTATFCTPACSSTGPAWSSSWCAFRFHPSCPAYNVSWRSIPINLFGTQCSQSRHASTQWLIRTSSCTLALCSWSHGAHCSTRSCGSCTKRSRSTRSCVSRTKHS